MLDAGAYRDHNVDISLIAHPGVTPDAALVRTAAYAGMKVEYFGKEAHAAARPWEGVRYLHYRLMTRLAILTILDQRARRARYSLQRSLSITPTDATRGYHPESNHQRWPETQHHPRIRLRTIRRPFGNKSPT